MDWHKSTESPESGKKIIALHGDGSGATLFLVHDHGLLDHDGDDYEKLAKEYDLWAYIPDSFELWFENQPDEQ